MKIFMFPSKMFCSSSSAVFNGQEGITTENKTYFFVFKHLNTVCSGLMTSGKYLMH